MATNNHPSNNDWYAYDRRELARSQASSAWAGVFKLALVLGAVAAFVWLLHYAFGMPGLQFGLILGFVIVVVVGIWELMKSTKQQTIDTVESTIRGIVEFQRADDQGEVARAAISALGSNQRAGTQLDANLLRLAGAIGKAQARGEIAAHEAQRTIEAVRTEANQAQNGRSAWYSYADSADGPEREDFHFHQ